MPTLTLYFLTNLKVELEFLHVQIIFSMHYLTGVKITYGVELINSTKVCYQLLVEFCGSSQAEADNWLPPLCQGG